MKSGQVAFLRRRLFQRGGLRRREGPFAARTLRLRGGWWNEGWWWALKMCVSAVGRPRQRSELPGREALSGQAEKEPKSRVERLISGRARSHPKNPHPLKPLPREGAPGIRGCLCHSSSSPCCPCLPRNVLHPARRVHVTPWSAGSVPLYTSENH